MDFYRVEQALELLKKLSNQLKKRAPSLGHVSKELVEFLSCIDLLLRDDFYEPRITRLMVVKKDIDKVLDEALLQVQSFNPKIAKVVSEKVPVISSLLAAWHNDIFLVKILPFLEGNQHLKNIPMHKHPDKFYVLVKELNPLKIVLKHPLTVIQARSQSGRPNSSLLAFDESDPISARRMWDHGDRGNAPGSSLKVESGHHRIYEIYKRYLAGKIDGDALIEVKKGD